MPYLLITTTRHHTNHTLYHDYGNARDAAIEFVGEHYPIDSCSTQPVTVEKVENQMMYASRRSTSFGPRDAHIIRVDYADEG